MLWREASEPRIDALGACVLNLALIPLAKPILQSALDAFCNGTDENIVKVLEHVSYEVVTQERQYRVAVSQLVPSCPFLHGLQVPVITCSDSGLHPFGP